MERILLTSNEDLIDESILPEQIRAEAGDRYTKGALGAAMDAFEKKIIMAAYKKHNTTVGVAKELGISQPTAARKIKKYIQI